MAWNGNVSGSGMPYITAQWSVTGQSTQYNTSTVKATFLLYYEIGTTQEIAYNISINGTSKSGTQTVSKYWTTGYIPIGTITATVYHDNDGTGEANIKGVCNGSTSLNAWVDLPKISRQATLLTAPNFNDEENPTITYSNPIGENATSLAAAISLDGTNPDIEYRDIDKNGTEYTFVLTEQERAILRAATDGGNTRTVLFYVRTIIGEDYYFSYKEATFTIINGMPEIDSSVIDVNTTTVALTGDEKTLVKYFSNAKAYMNMIAYKEAYFTAYYIENGGKRIDSSYSHTFNAVENNVFNFYIADNRNNAVSQAYNAPMVDYIKLTCNYNATKLQASGEMIVKCSGNYFNSTFGAAANTITAQYRYKEQGGEWGGWYAMTATSSGNTYTAETEITGLNYRKTYIFQCRAIDKLMSVSSAETTIKSIPLFHWGADDFVFEVPVSFNAGIIGIDSGEWLPTLNNADAVSEYTLQKGWYSRVGNVVSIGWQIKANIKDGYNTNSIAIKGMPFNPAYAAFGGGVAHNIYITGNFNFEGWAANTDGTITARIQPSNNTAAGNLNISSGTYYPTGAVSITLAGTICYTTNDV